MSESILTSTKKVLGIDESYTVFDQDIILHLNSIFADLNQLGIGPPEGFFVVNEANEWSQFMGSELRLNAVKSYVYLRLRLLFDPPASSFVVASMEKQIEKAEWRINIAREEIVYPQSQEG